MDDQLASILSAIQACQASVASFDSRLNSVELSKQANPSRRFPAPSATVTSADLSADAAPRSHSPYWEDGFTGKPRAFGLRAASGDPSADDRERQVMDLCPPFIRQDGGHASLGKPDDYQHPALAPSGFTSPAVRQVPSGPAVRQHGTVKDRPLLATASGPGIPTISVPVPTGTDVHVVGSSDEEPPMDVDGSIADGPPSRPRSDAGDTTLDQSEPSTTASAILRDWADRCVDEFKPSTEADSGESDDPFARATKARANWVRRLRTGRPGLVPSNTMPPLGLPKGIRASALELHGCGRPFPCTAHCFPRWSPDRPWRKTLFCACPKLRVSVCLWQTTPSWRHKWEKWLRGYPPLRRC